MDGDNVTVAIQTSSSITATDMTGSSSVLDGASRLCPLCQSEVRLFFINFNEKMLMCENTHCEFPFGHEELQFVKEDSDANSDEECISIQSRVSQGSPTGTCSISGWSDADKIISVYEESQIEDESQVKIKKRDLQLADQAREQMLKHIEDIKQLNKELMSPTDDHTAVVHIQNQKWIKNLKNLQEMSGVQLLKPEEIGLLRKEEPVLGLGELKIDVDPENSNRISSISIEIYNKLDNDEMHPTEKSPP